MAPRTERDEHADDGYEQEGDSHRSSVPLDLDGDGDQESVIAQEPAGARSVAGGGEFPDRDTPPSPAAKGYDRDRQDDEVEDDDTEEDDHAR